MATVQNILLIGLAVRFFRFFMLLSFASVLAACAVIPYRPHPPMSSGDPHEITILDTAISPNGQIVAFEFAVGQNRGLGLYEWGTGKLTHIPNPAGHYLTSPSFSHDGRQLAVVSFSSVDNPQGKPGDKRGVWDVDVVDVATLETTQITNDEAVTPSMEHGIFSTKSQKLYPTFQPGDQNILYFESGVLGPWGLYMVNVKDHKVATILDKSHGFHFAETPSFVNDNEIYFVAEGPSDKNVENEVDEIGGKYGYSPGARAPYSLRLGETPHMLHPDTQRSFPSLGNIAEINMFGLAASHNGEVIVTSSVANAKSGGLYDYEIFQLTKATGELTQLSSLHSITKNLNISDDGSTVVILSDPMRRRIYDLVVFDVRSRQATDTHLLQRITLDPNFSSN